VVIYLGHFEKRERESSNSSSEYFLLFPPPLFLFSLFQRLLFIYTPKIIFSCVKFFFFFFFFSLDTKRSTHFTERQHSFKNNSKWPKHRVNLPRAPRREETRREERDVLRRTLLTSTRYVNFSLCVYISTMCTHTKYKTGTQASAP